MQQPQIHDNMPERLSDKESDLGAVPSRGWEGRGSVFAWAQYLCNRLLGIQGFRNVPGFGALDFRDVSGFGIWGVLGGWGGFMWQMA